MADMILHARKPRRLRQFVFFSAALLWAVVLTASAAVAQNCVCAERESAKTWAMHGIAMMQAAAGEFQAAKRTVSQITEEGEKRPAVVTGVSFCKGQPIYYWPPPEWFGLAPVAAAPAGTYLGPLPPEAHGARCPAPGNRFSQQLPAAPSPGLPANYLAPDPRHGAVVAFTDERDINGTRVTWRRYADGYAVIETPKL